jgi:hypothetical protein
MDGLLSRYAASASAYASAVEDLSVLSQTRHTRSAYLAALEFVEKARQESELARRDFQQPRKKAK